MLYPQEAGRLQRMAEDHAVKLDHPSEAVRLPTLFTAGRLEGSHQSKVAAVQVCVPSPTPVLDILP